MELIHYGVAGVDALGAADAFVLQTVSDINARGAYLNAEAAVHAVPGAFRGALLGTPRFAPGRVVGNDERIWVEHGGLEAGVGAHIEAGLLPHDAAHKEGHEGEKAQPKGGPAREGEGGKAL